MDMNIIGPYVIEPLVLCVLAVGCVWLIVKMIKSIFKK